MLLRTTLRIFSQNGRRGRFFHVTPFVANLLNLLTKQVRSISQICSRFEAYLSSLPRPIENPDESFQAAEELESENRIEEAIEIWEDLAFQLNYRPALIKLADHTTDRNTYEPISTWRLLADHEEPTLHACSTVALYYQTGGPNGHQVDHQLAFEYWVRLLEHAKYHSWKAVWERETGTLVFSQSRASGPRRKSATVPDEIIQDVVDSTGTDTNNVGMALHYIGLLYWDGNAGLQRDEEKAIEFWRAASLPLSNHTLGRVYYERQMFQHAFLFYVKAKESGLFQNDTMMSYYLATMYHRGLGCERDIKKAIDLYSEAALCGNHEARLQYEFLNWAVRKEAKILPPPDPINE